MKHPLGCWGFSGLLMLLVELFIPTLCSAAPTVLDITPLYGPQDGERLTITGTELMDPAIGEITIGQARCRCSTGIKGYNCNNSTVIFCDVYGNMEQLNEPLPVNIIGIALTQEYWFVFKERAKLMPYYHPTKTFISGGIPISFTGQKLDSVYRYQLQLVSSFPCFEQVVGSETSVECVVGGNSSLVCLTPPTYMPRKINELRTVKNDSVICVNDEYFFVQILVGNSLSSKLGGHMCVTMDPLFKKAWVFHSEVGDRLVHIEGKHLNDGCSLSNYNVTVNGEACNMASLTSTILVCSLKTLPYSDKYEVRIRVGYITEFLIGKDKLPPSGTGGTISLTPFFSVCCGILTVTSLTMTNG